MPRLQDLQSSFSAGEISERLAARLDFVKYPAALDTCENLIPLSEGGVMRRPGTRHVTEIKSSTVKGRVKKFQFSITQAYIVEMANLALRFNRNQSRIMVADTDVAITNGTFTSNITGWTNRSTGLGSIAHDAVNLDLDLIPGGTAAADIGWAEQTVTTLLLNREYVIKFRVKGDPGDKIEFQVGTAASGAQTLAAVEKEVGYHCVAFTPTTTIFYVQFRNLGTNANKTVSIDDVSIIDNAQVEIDSPWPEAELYDVEGPQTADVLYLFHDATPTYKLQRFGHTTWSLVEVAWQDGPYLDLNVTTTTLTPGATSGVAVTVTASSIVGINDNTGFQTTDVGRLIRIDNPAAGVAWGWGIIVARTSTTVVTVHVKKAFGATTADTRWKLGAWSATTGYPQCATLFEERLYSANTTKQPQTLWASQTDDFENQKPDNDADVVEADDAFSRTLSADTVDAIRWLSAGENRLVIGTSSGEWVPKSSGEALTALDISIKRQTAHGSARIQPVRVGNTVLFIQRAKRKIREFGLSQQSVADTYVAPDMSRLAQHIMKGGVVEMDFAEEPESLVWIVRNDGQLLSMTFRRDEDVVGWGRHILGGKLYGSITKVWQVDASPETFVDETTDANSTGNADWTVFPTTEAVGDYAAFGYTKPFTKLVFDYANGTAGVGGVVTWEYWNGTIWTALSGVTDNTSGFTAAVADNRSVTWTEPTNWTKRVISSGVLLYYVRARLTTVYTTNPILDQGFIADNPVVESVAVIPGTNGSGQIQSSENRDEVWMIVRRTINGVTRRYIEFFERAFETGDNQEDAYYVDSMITYDGALTVAFIDSGNDSLRIYWFNGTDWAQVGNSLVIAGVGNPMLAALNATDVAFIDDSNDSLRTYRFDGTDWAQVGNSLAIATVGSSALAALNATDVAFIDSNNEFLRTYRFNGTDWAQVGNSLAIATVGTPALAALNGTDVAFIDNSNDSLRTYRFDGTNWAQVGNSFSIAGIANVIVLAALNGTDVAFIDADNDSLRTYRFDGTDWAQIGNSLAITGVGNPALAKLNGTNVVTLGGFSHLEGETVRILANGAIHTNKTVSSSQIVLDSAKSVVQGGLGYTHKLKTLKVHSGNPAGTPIGKKKRIYGLTFVLLNSHTLKYGPDANNLTEKDFRLVADSTNAAAPLFTGEKFVEFPGDWMQDGRIVIQSDDPAPFTMLALAPETQLNPSK